MHGRSIGGRSTGYHHGRFHHSVASLGIVPLYYVSESCDPATDPYCNVHAMHFGIETGEADVDTGDIPYYALNFVPESDPYWDELNAGADPEVAFNRIGNTAGILALGKTALVLGGIGALGYGAYKLTHPNKGLPKP